MHVKKAPSDAKTGKTASIQFSPCISQSSLHSRVQLPWAKQTASHLKVDLVTKIFLSPNFYLFMLILAYTAWIYSRPDCKEQYLWHRHIFPTNTRAAACSRGGGDLKAQQMLACFSVESNSLNFRRPHTFWKRDLAEHWFPASEADHEWESTELWWTRITALCAGWVQFCFHCRATVLPVSDNIHFWSAVQC